MKKLLTLVVLLSFITGFSYPVTSFAGDYCDPIVIKKVVEPDGFVRSVVTYNFKCLNNGSSVDDASVDKNLEILPDNPTDPSGSFKVRDPNTYTTKTYIPQSDGTLKVRPW